MFLGIGLPSYPQIIGGGEAVLATAQLVRLKQHKIVLQIAVDGLFFQCIFIPVPQVRRNP
jgi:hypothetical protein